MKHIILVIFVLISFDTIAGYNGDIGYSGTPSVRQVKTSGFEKLLNKQFQSNAMKNARYWKENSAAVGSLGAGMKALVKIPIQQGVDLFAAGVGLVTKPSLAGAALLAKKAVPIAGYLALADWFLSAGVQYNDDTQQFEETTETQFPTRRFRQTVSSNLPCYSYDENCTVEEIYQHAKNHWTNLYPTDAPFTPRTGTGHCNTQPAGSCVVLFENKDGFGGYQWTGGSSNTVEIHEPTITPISESEAIQKLENSPLVKNETDSSEKFDKILDDLDKANQLPEPESIEMSGPSELNHPGYPKTETHPDKVVETDKKNTITYQGDTITISPTITTQTTIYNDNTTEVITSEEALPEPESEEEEKEDKDPCEDFPERVSCWEAGDTPNIGEMPTDTIELTYTPEEIGTSGECPAPTSMALSFATIEFPIQPTCDFATAVKPFFIVFASLTAIFIMFSEVRN